MGVETCGQLQRFELGELARRLKGAGAELYKRCRGIDERTADGDRSEIEAQLGRAHSHHLNAHEGRTAQKCEIGTRAKRR